jgi:hypothetical protein
MRRSIAVLLVVFLSGCMVFQLPPLGRAWSNGGFSSDPNNPDYGTHDFLAHHALDYVPDDDMTQRRIVQE